MERVTYQSTLRRSERSLPGLLALLAVLGIAVFVIVRYSGGGDAMMKWLLTTVVGFLLALAAVALCALRVHRWTIDADGLAIEERPKVPLMGRKRSVRLAFADIAAMVRVQSGFDAVLELVARNGSRYRLSSGFLAANGRNVHVPDVRSLDAFAAALRAAATQAGHELPTIGQGLSFWNRPFGLFLLAVMLLLSLALAGLVLFALWDGMSVRPRSGDAIAAVLLLPFGAAYLLYKSLKRRRAVLSAQQASPR